MTAQIADHFVFNNEEYSIVSRSTDIEFKPSDYNMEPIPISSGCWRGYYCTFVISNDGLFLEQLTVREKNEFYPSINGAEPRPYEHLIGYIDNICDDSVEVNHITCRYDNIHLRIPYTGTIVMGREFLDDYYIHMGFQRAWAYKELLECDFQNGYLVHVKDQSKIAESLRDNLDIEEFEQKSFDDIISFIDDSFSLDLKDKAWWII